jgi:hypothetical protein
MRTIVLAIVAAMAATSALAEDTVTKTQTPVMGPVLSGAVTLDFAETTNNNYGGTFGLDLGIDAPGVATVDLDFKATDGNALTLDTWTVATTVGAFGVAVGDDNGLLPETTADAAADGTLTVPAMTESVQVTMGAASVAVGLSDYTTDVTEVSNLQGAYTIDAGIVDVTASVDYNRTSENYVWGGEFAGLDLGAVTAGGMMTYDNDADLFAYESTVGVSGFTAYVNGTDVDALQNVGGEWTKDLDTSLTFTVGANYDTDAKDLTPRAGLSFNF